MSPTCANAESLSFGPTFGRLMGVTGRVALFHAGKWWADPSLKTSDVQGGPGFIQQVRCSRCKQWSNSGLTRANKRIFKIISGDIIDISSYLIFFNVIWFIPDEVQSLLSTDFRHLGGSTWINFIIYRRCCRYRCRGLHAEIQCHRKCVLVTDCNYRFGSSQSGQLYHSYFCCHGSHFTDPNVIDS